jgi:hypothetical protein
LIFLCKLKSSTNEGRRGQSHWHYPSSLQRWNYSHNTAKISSTLSQSSGVSTGVCCYRVSVLFEISQRVGLDLNRPPLAPLALSAARALKSSVCSATLRHITCDEIRCAHFISSHLSLTYYVYALRHNCCVAPAPCRQLG